MTFLNSQDFKNNIKSLYWSKTMETFYLYINFRTKDTFSNEDWIL